MSASQVPPPKFKSLPEKRLALYGVAAGAALASGASQANADLITLDLTGLSLSTRTTPINGNLFFDVNATSPGAAVGTAFFAGADFYFKNSSGGGTMTAGIVGTGSTLNAIVVSKFDAVRFTTSDNIGPSAAKFLNFAFIAFQSTGGTSGNFAPGDTGYIGLRFTFADPSDIHYGWANITLNNDYTVTLNALGYESDANTAAHVEAAAIPEPSTIALLALGAVGVAAFRKRQRNAA